MADDIHNHESDERQKNGMTTIDRFDIDLVFDALKLKKKDVFADIGCGAGDYAFKASELVGNSGLVYAFDQWEEIEKKINSKSILLGINNIKTLTGTVLSALPIKNNSCDVCFISMVLHGFDMSKHGEGLFNEFRRILKPDGKLAIIEIKKQETPFGPPQKIRITPDIFESLASVVGFKNADYTDLGHCYMIQFEANK